eukprot:CAMPEP_0182421470 /NCGR_PEP_ID=MMETSP1167-20130531/6890_1 /TAXON_ID=2988 /ORGANISM="Mallomonas Sp, Strain CCMP3275" /LENGTH=464 /DNA_ID=CAMNT_0024598661 /DNA_START=29 /DNA_END=1423 /DNA_ORIENTATION=+
MGVTISTTHRVFEKIQKYTWDQIETMITAYYEGEYEFVIKASDISDITGLESSDAQSIISNLGTSNGIANAMVVWASFILLADSNSKSVTQDMRINQYFNLFDFRKNSMISVDEMMISVLSISAAVNSIFGTIKIPSEKQDKLLDIFKKLNKSQNSNINSNDYRAWANQTLKILPITEASGLFTLLATQEKKISSDFYTPKQVDIPSSISIQDKEEKEKDKSRHDNYKDDYADDKDIQKAVRTSTLNTFNNSGTASAAVSRNSSIRNQGRLSGSGKERKDEQEKVEVKEKAPKNEDKEMTNNAVAERKERETERQSAEEKAPEKICDNKDEGEKEEEKPEQKEEGKDQQKEEEREREKEEKEREREKQEKEKEATREESKGEAKEEDEEYDDEYDEEEFERSADAAEETARKREAQEEEEGGEAPRQTLVTMRSLSASMESSVDQSLMTAPVSDLQDDGELEVF